MNKKTIRSIHFLTDKVIVDYGEHKVFQFCKACKNGKHMKAFLGHFCPQLNLSQMDETTAILMEKKFHRTLAHGTLRQLVNFEAYKFGDYVAARLERNMQRR